MSFVLGIYLTCPVEYFCPRKNKSRGRGCKGVAVDKFQRALDFCYRAFDTLQDLAQLRARGGRFLRSPVYYCYFQNDGQGARCFFWKAGIWKQLPPHDLRTCLILWVCAHKVNLASDLL